MGLYIYFGICSFVGMLSIMEHVLSVRYRNKRFEASSFLLLFMFYVPVINIGFFASYCFNLIEEYDFSLYDMEEKVSNYLTNLCRTGMSKNEL